MGATIGKQVYSVFIYILESGLFTQKQINEIKKIISVKQKKESKRPKRTQKNMNSRGQHTARGQKDSQQQKLSTSKQREKQTLDQSTSCDEMMYENKSEGQLQISEKVSKDQVAVVEDNNEILNFEGISPSQQTSISKMVKQNDPQDEQKIIEMTQQYLTQSEEIQEQKNETELIYTQSQFQQNEQPQKEQSCSQFSLQLDSLKNQQLNQEIKPSQPWNSLIKSNNEQTNVLNFQEQTNLDQLKETKPELPFNQQQQQNDKSMDLLLFEEQTNLNQLTKMKSELSQNFISQQNNKSMELLKFEEQKNLDQLPEIKHELPFHQLQQKNDKSMDLLIQKELTTVQNQLQSQIDQKERNFKEPTEMESNQQQIKSQQSKIEQSILQVPENEIISICKTHISSQNTKQNVNKLTSKKNQKINFIGQINNRRMHKNSQGYIKKNIIIDTSDHKKLVLLGITGVGKTALFQKISNNSKSPNQSTTEVQIQQIMKKDKLALVDTPPFSIDNEIEQREIFIGEMQKFFLANQYKISGLVIVVNFERTDLMKKKVTDIFKYIRRFKAHGISIIVTDWNLSQNQSQDEQSLKASFKVYQPKYIKFVENQINAQALKSIFQEISNPQELQKFDLTDTIFEIQEDDPKFMNMLNNLALSCAKRQ